MIGFFSCSFVVCNIVEYVIVVAEEVVVVVLFCNS